MKLYNYLTNYLEYLKEFIILNYDEFIDKITLNKKT